MQHVLLLFLADTFERSGICLLVDEPSRIRIPLDPAVCFWVMNLRSVSNRPMTVPITRWWIFRHFLPPSCCLLDRQFLCITAKADVVEIPPPKVLGLFESQCFVGHRLTPP